jgi:hypothetical protein
MSEKFTFFDNFIISIEDDAVDVYVPARPVNEKLVYDKYWVVLADMSDFEIVRNGHQEFFIYGITNGTIVKKDLVP